ncbi:hypothetical protein FA951_10515 [Dermacoccus nishinomiyaensis]|uniref:alpha/beta hydrolase family protein n=1 Tax=Dermacoccus nishinomiyaensis TaxID=1274 RepID=UPI0010ADA3A4|nr:alpha/beta family hydrolase [Dermacoccus nishinomiyaensis]MCT1603798.1 hypothetical protein [Dermacoccus nishinomiyaensis]TJZ95739.1 hypothetical protein FA951_10515 [Dermacoccus nishinomiyaensis]
MTAEPRPSRSVAPERAHRVLDIETDAGPARAYVIDPVGGRANTEVKNSESSSTESADPDTANAETAAVTTTGKHQPVGTLVLGHGAGKGTNTPDLWGLLDLADDGWRVVLVDQPWVLAGRKIATPPKTLDEGWRAVVSHLREAGEITGRFVQGGRSAGARVACRTAVETGADAVVALAFPLTPPGKADDPSKWRTDEAQAVLDAVVPLLVVQGATDTFGDPDAIRAALPGADVAAVAGPHGFSKQPQDVVDAVRRWLAAAS